MLHHVVNTLPPLVIIGIYLLIGSLLTLAFYIGSRIHSSDNYFYDDDVCYACMVVFWPILMLLLIPLLCMGIGAIVRKATHRYIQKRRAIRRAHHRRLHELRVIEEQLDKELGLERFYRAD